MKAICTVVFVIAGVAGVAMRSEATAVQPVLVFGMEVPKFGRIATPNINTGYSDEPDMRGCLGEDGTIVTNARTVAHAGGLVCIDGDGPRVMVRAGDPAPDGGFFSRFYRCRFVAGNRILFTAHRRFAIDGTAGESVLYRTGATGIERVIGTSDLSSENLGELTGSSSIDFAASDDGQVLVRVNSSVGAQLFLPRPDAPPLRITTGDSFIGQAAITTRGDVVVAGSEALLAWRDGVLQTLAEGIFWLVDAHGDSVTFSGGDFDARTTVHYDAADGTARLISEDDPVLDARNEAFRISREVDAANGPFVDVTPLAYNQRGNVLVTLEDPGAGDLLLAGPAPARGRCPSNDGLSDSVPILATPVPGATPIPTPTRAPVDPIMLEAQVDPALPGTVADLRVVLRGQGQRVAGVQIDIGAPWPLSLVENANHRPDCTPNPASGKDYTVFSFPYGEDYMRAIVLSLTNVDPIPDNSLLFTCRLQVSADALPGSYPLALMRLAGSTGRGEPIDAVASGGVVMVTDPSSRAIEVGPGAPDAGGGCGIPTRTGSASVVFLLLPAALLAWRRVRHPAGGRKRE